MLACLIALFALLAWCRARVTFGIVGSWSPSSRFSNGGEKRQLSPDNERIMMGLRAIKRYQEEASRRR